MSRQTRGIQAALVLAALSAATLAQAGDHSWSWAGRRGGTWSRTVAPYHNGGGNFGRTVTTTRPNGKTATSTFNRTVSNGTITDTHTHTGFNGKTSSTTLTRTPGQGWSAVHTGPNGQTQP